RADGALTHDAAGTAWLEYDFTASRATRTISVWPPEAITVAGQPTRLTARLWGGGDGAWPSLECRDADGIGVVLRGPVIDWHGWRDIDLPVPDTVRYPLRVE